MLPFLKPFSKILEHRVRNIPVDLLLPNCNKKFKTNLKTSNQLYNFGCDFQDKNAFNKQIYKKMFLAKQPCASTVLFAAFKSKIIQFLQA